MNSKENKANDAFESYNFGEGVNVVAHGNWDTSDQLDYTKIVYVMFEDEPTELDSHKISFHVNFTSQDNVCDVYAISMESGNEVGRYK